MWLPMEEFLSGEVYFLEANPDNTLTEPGTSRHAMTVAYYNSDDNAVDINSGRGYTRDGIIKPDFAAPGVNITGAGIQKNFVTRSSSSERYRSIVPYPHSSLGYSACGCRFAPSTMIVLIWLALTPLAPGCCMIHSRSNATAPAVIPVAALELLLVTK